MMKYVVKLGWRSEFMFNNINEAADFANSAAEARIKGEDDTDEISIRLVEVKEDQEDV